MSEDAGAVPVPYVLDVSVLIAVARADAGVTDLLMGFDAEGRSLLIPALAVTGASLDARTEDGDLALRGLESLENTFTAGLQSAEQATRCTSLRSPTRTRRRMMRVRMATRRSSRRSRPSSHEPITSFGFRSPSRS